MSAVFEEKSIKDLKALAAEGNVDLRGCTEKADIIERLLKSQSAASASMLSPSESASLANKLQNDIQGLL